MALTVALVTNCIASRTFDFFMMYISTSGAFPSGLVGWDAAKLAGCLLVAGLRLACTPFKVMGSPLYILKRPPAVHGLLL